MPTSCGAEVALRVLTDPSLLSEIVAWSAGWPGIVAYKLLPSLSPDAVDWRIRETPTPEAVKWRVGEPTPTVGLLRIADPRTLAAAANAVWWNDQGQLKGFQLDDAELALQSGNANAARFVFERTERRPITNEDTRNYWLAAISCGQGRCDLLDVVNEFAPPDVANLTYSLMYYIKHASVARWFVEHFGAAILPSGLIQNALHRGDLGLYYYLHTTPGQVQTAHMVNASVRDPDHRLLCGFITKCDTATARIYGNQLLRLAAKTNDGELLEQVLASAWAARCREDAVQEATEALARLTTSGQ